MIALAHTTRQRRDPGDKPLAVAEAFGADVLEGLCAVPKRLPSKYFYDAAGSELFELITDLPEYYPTRTELGILRANGDTFRSLLPARAAIVEFGSGSTSKARILLDAVAAPAAYVPVDISSEFLAHEAARLKSDQPQLSVLPVNADFTQPFELPSTVTGHPLIGFFPGSTIGNFEPHQAVAFLRQAAKVLGPAASFVVGVDLIKDSQVLFDAYNDAQGVTARFNLNLLVRINRELGANFDPGSFEHHAFFNRELRRVEMHLASLRRQKVRVAGRNIDFRAGETIHTENSYKYTIPSFTALAHGAGWLSRAVLTDPSQYFSVHVLQREVAGVR
jgi:dimethylhistidine N-methyltransferase